MVDVVAGVVNDVVGAVTHVHNVVVKSDVIVVDVGGEDVVHVVDVVVCYFWRLL